MGLTSAVDPCELELRRAILSGEIPKGARLPSERELAARLGASRVTVRSALSRLAGAHLLSVRQGSGYVVRDFRREGGPDLLPGLAELAQKDDLVAIAADLLVVRRALARAVLERLAEAKPARAPLDAIGAAIGAFDRLTARSAPAAIAEADLAVLRALLDATRSSVFGLCLNPVVSVLGAMPALRDAIYRDPRESAQAYRALLAWLEAPDARGIDAILGVLADVDDKTLRALRSRLAKKEASR